MSRIRNTGIKVISYCGNVYIGLKNNHRGKANSRSFIRNNSFFVCGRNKLRQDMAPPMHEEEFANMAVILSTLTDTAILPTFHKNSEDSAES
jgi:hypothetical protein